MSIDISRAHDEYYRIHEKCPEPDRARMDPHPIECHGESKETERYEKHSRTRSSKKCSNRRDECHMWLLDYEWIGTDQCESDTESTPDIDTLTKKEDTREYGSDGNESLQWSNERNISECERLEIEVLAKIIKYSSSSNYPEKSRIDMIRDSLMDEEWECDDHKCQWANPCHHSGIERLQRLLRRNILEGIEEW